MKKKASHVTISKQAIEGRIFVIRGHKVVLDSELAGLYGVPTKRLNEQIKRNRRRFPEDFAFRLTSREVVDLKSQEATLNRSQFATGSQKHRDPRSLPYVFTEHGVLMVANVLNSSRAVTMSIYIVRAFIRLREVFVVNQVLQDRLAEIEEILFNHDSVLQDFYKKIRLFLEPPKKTDAIGFQFASPRIGKIG